VNNVDLRLLDRFRIAQRLNRGGGNELRSLDALRARVEEQRRLLLNGGTTTHAVAATRAQVADVIRFPARD
jgi:hypothetical protein